MFQFCKSPSLCAKQYKLYYVHKFWAPNIQQSTIHSRKRLNEKCLCVFVVCIVYVEFRPNEYYDQMNYC